jgi:Lipid A 3-O-deacylase (PagL)
MWVFVSGAGPSLSERRRTFTLRCKFSQFRKIQDLLAEEPPEGSRSAVGETRNENLPPMVAVMRLRLLAFALVSNVAGSVLFGQMVFPADGASHPSCARYPAVSMEEVDGWAAGQQGLSSGDAASTSTSTAVARVPQRVQRPDFNRDIYYRNKLEFSLETGWLPINIPFVFDFVVDSPYTTWPLRYTMVPNIASLRWHVDGIDHAWIFRGNWDFTFSGSYTAIPRGAETRYFAFDYSIRRNFVPPRSRIVPFFDMRGGIGDINAKGPDGVLYAQGQNLTFTLMLGSGARYDFSPRTSVEAGAEYMHVSNAYLSQPKYEDFGINVRIGKQKRHTLY